MIGTWSDQIFRYCERGQSGAIWAEPFNALSNGAFIAAALVAALVLASRPDAARRVVLWLLTLLVAVIGIGSFLFHTTATRWASYADTIPIGVFMLAYLAFALRVYLRLHWLLVAAALALFDWSMHTLGGVACRSTLLPVTAAARAPCYNGSLAYVPAAAAMALVGLALAVQRHRAAPWLLAAGVVFVVSLAARTLDIEWCGVTRLFGRTRGTHAIWHVCNAVTLLLLLLAAAREERGASEQGAGDRH